MEVAVFYCGSTMLSVDNTMNSVSFIPCYRTKQMGSTTKSLLEIQEEQARQVERERKMREENQQQAAKVEWIHFFFSKISFNDSGKEAF